LFRHLAEGDGQRTAEPVSHLDGLDDTCFTILRRASSQQLLLLSFRRFYTAHGFI